jgi:hypothetical protein
MNELICRRRARAALVCGRQRDEGRCLVAAAYTLPSPRLTASTRSAVTTAGDGRADRGRRWVRVLMALCHKVAPALRCLQVLPGALNSGF